LLVLHVLFPKRHKNPPYGNLNDSTETKTKVIFEEKQGVSGSNAKRVPAANRSYIAGTQGG
jgi:hypothetical protein